MRISLFGGPNSGKSTLAAKLAGKLKETYDIEIISEYFKDWVYNKRNFTKYDQLLAFAKQISREEKIIQYGVAHLITDSPILLQTVYAPIEYRSYLIEMAKYWDWLNPHVNILLKRDLPFNPSGRIHNLEESIKKDEEIKNLLIDCGENYYEVSPNDFDSIYNICENAIQKL